MTTQACPSDGDLREYAIGNCNDLQYHQIESHLNLCRTCEDTVAQFDEVQDTLMRHLPLAATGQSNASASSLPWLDRLRKEGPGAIESQPQVAPAPAITPPLEGLANYELLGVLGQGGMGIVYLARHRQLNRRVALKVLSPRLLAAPEAHARFRREIQLLGSLHHPGIVMATDAGTVASGAYLVMELIDGADLSRVVRETGPLSVAEACEVGRQLAEALAAAHESGAIHRDVKPSNVMIDRQQGRVRLLDFGLARLELSLLETGGTSLGRLLGTLDYMAPEQSGGDQAVSLRTDLYGLGATMFYLLTGRPPHGSHAGRSLLDSLRMIASEPVPRLRSFRIDVPEGLDAFIASLLSNQPDQRPVSASVAAHELAQWAGGSLINRAREISPASVSLESNPRGVADAAKSLSEFLGTPPTDDSHGTLSLASTNSSLTPVRFSHRIWIMCLAVITAGFFGIVILVDTPQGRLRIESDVDNVQVELVNEQEHSQEIKIEAGQTTKETKLRAGQYRITLSGRHDGLTIDRDIVTLHRGEQTVARITRVSQPPDTRAERRPNNPVLANPDQVSGRGPELQYQGKTESEWQRRFESEIEPVSKLEAAEALMSIAADLPDDQNLDRILDVGQEIVRATFGSDSLLFAFEGPANPPTNARRWPLSEAGPAYLAYQQFQKGLNDRVGKLSGEQLADKLTTAIVLGPDARAAFAYSLFKYAAKNRIREVPDAVRLTLDRLNVTQTGFDRSSLAVLARFQLIDEAPADVRPSLLTAMNDLADRLRSSPRSMLNDRLRDGLIAAVQSIHGQHDAASLPADLSQSLARLVLRDIVDGRPNAMFALPFRRGVTGAIPPYDQTYIDEIRRDMWYFLPAWIAVANEYLADHKHPPYSPADRNVVKSLNLVLLTMSASDDWPIGQTAEILTDQLRVSYTEPRDLAASDRLPASASLLLTQIVRLTGVIPEFVRAEQPQTLSVEKRVAQLKQLLDGKVEAGPNGMYWQFDELKGLLDDAPYDTIRLAVGEKRLPENTPMILRGLQVPLEPIELLYVTSDLNDDRNNRHTPPIDPLLLLVALEGLTGVSEWQDQWLSTFFADRRPNRVVLRSHLERLGSKSRYRGTADQALRTMAAKAKSRKLVTAIGSLNPELTNGVQ